MKLLRRRKKKQLFDQWKRKKQRRESRSLLSPLVSWVLGKKESEEEGKQQEKTNQDERKMKVSGLGEIASKKVKDIPSDFFKVVTASTLEVSQFSRDNQGEAFKSDKRRKRKRKNIDISLDVTWAGIVKSGNIKCPAYLVTSTHVLVRGPCEGDNMSVDIAGYKLNLSTAVFHPYESLSLFTLRTPLPRNIETLCYPELVKYLTSDNHMLRKEWNNVKEWLQFALN